MCASVERVMPSCSVAVVGLDEGAGGVRVRVLGPIELLRDDGIVRLTGLKEQMLLAALAQRANQVLAESIELLERILAHTSPTGLLDAIADGTFGLMKRPADAGRGLDGVALKAPGYLNPASDLLEAR